MGQDSGIQWTNHTFNPWTRCVKVSPACDNCYAETWAGRATHPKDSTGKALPLWGAYAPRNPTTSHNWNQPKKWNAAAESSGVRARVFCASLADVFEEHHAITASGARERLWSLIEATPSLDWLLLTKRPENMRAMLPAAWLANPRHNVWLGTTAESQEYVDARLPHLLSTPAVVHFVSAEPLMGPIDLRGFRPSWLIVGGESGAAMKVRPFDVEWARSLVRQCRANGRTAAFVKQFGAHVIDAGHVEEWPTGTRHEERLDEVGARVIQQGWRVRLRDSHGGDMAEWPADLCVREFPAVIP